MELDLQQRLEIKSPQPRLPCFWLVYICKHLQCLCNHDKREKKEKKEKAAIAFVSRPKYTMCHVGRVAGSMAHGRFSGFNYISLAGR